MSRKFLLQEIVNGKIFIKLFSRFAKRLRMPLTEKLRERERQVVARRLTDDITRLNKK